MGNRIIIYGGLAKIWNTVEMQYKPTFISFQFDVLLLACIYIWLAKEQVRFVVKS